MSYLSCTHLPSLVPRPIEGGGGKNAWYILTVHALLFTQNLGDRKVVVASYIPRPFEGGGGKRAWYILTVHELLFTPNLGDCKVVNSLVYAQAP